MTASTLKTCSKNRIKPCKSTGVISKPPIKPYKKSKSVQTPTVFPGEIKNVNKMKINEKPTVAVVGIPSYVSNNVTPDDDKICTKIVEKTVAVAVADFPYPKVIFDDSQNVKISKEHFKTLDVENYSDDLIVLRRNLSLQEHEMLYHIIISTRDFASNMYQIVCKEHENVLFSPIGIYLSLVLTYLGANGKTGEQIEKYLFLPPHKILLPAIRLLTDQLKKPELNLTTEMYADTRFKIRREYEKIAIKCLDTKVHRLNFKNAVNQAEELINARVFFQTKGNIKRIFDAGTLTKNTKLLLLSVVYFKDRWQSLFSSCVTRQNFHIDTTKSVEVQMMTNTGYYKYLERDTFKVLKLIYQDGESSMIIFLPNEIDGLREMEEKLISTDINEILDDMRFVKARVQLPKFEMEAQINLKETFQRMGITTMFSDRYADLRGIYERTATIDTILNVRTAEHKALFKVNESGTDDVVLPKLELNHGNHPTDEETREFEVNRPFVFCVMHRDVILLLGKNVTGNGS